MFRRPSADRIELREGVIGERDGGTDGIEKLRTEAAVAQSHFVVGNGVGQGDGTNICRRTAQGVSFVMGTFQILRFKSPVQSVNGLGEFKSRDLE